MAPSVSHSSFKRFSTPNRYGESDGGATTSNVNIGIHHFLNSAVPFVYRNKTARSSALGCRSQDRRAWQRLPGKPSVLNLSFICLP
jgi:hypothetical protein